MNSPDLIESLASLNSRTNSSSGDEQQQQQLQQEHCKRCQQNQMQLRQVGIVQPAPLHQTTADDETNPRYHSQVCNTKPLFVQ